MPVDTRSLGKQAMVLAAVRNGCETCADVEVELNFTLTRHQIAGHLSNLLRAGRIRKTGEFAVPTERRRRGRIEEGAVRAYRYEVVP